jgi:hypothetical protein
MSASWWSSLALFVIATLGIVLASRREKRRSLSDDHARCGHCGYPIRGLPTSICPECGADRNVVGVRRPSGWNRQTPAGRGVISAAIWTVWLGWGGWLLDGPYQRYLQTSTWHGYNCTTITYGDAAWGIGIVRVWHLSGRGDQALCGPAPGVPPRVWCAWVIAPGTADATRQMLECVEHDDAPETAGLPWFMVQSARGMVTFRDQETGEPT